MAGTRPATAMGAGRRIADPARAGGRRTEAALSTHAGPADAAHRPRVVLSMVLHGAILVAIVVFLHRIAVPPGIPEQAPVPMVFAASPAQPPSPVTQPPPQAVVPIETTPASRLPVPPPRVSPPRRTAALSRSVVTPSPPAVAPPAASTGPPSAASAAAAATFAAPRPVAAMASDRPPAYPEIARRRGEQGRTVLRVSVGPDGVARDVSVALSSGYAVLDDAAMSAVRGWRFVPASRGGAPVAAVAEVPVRFRLEDP